MSDEIPQTPIQPARRSLLDRVSIVWVIPIGALLIALGIAVQSYRERGALIEIRFVNASGIVAEQTALRFRDVEVGIVENVRFSDDLTEVIASVRLDQQVEPFVDAEAQFWIVRPEVSIQGVRGLDTVLSGVYIEGNWDEVPGGLHRAFRGLEDAPLYRADEKGAAFTLRSASGRGLREGTAIFYKGLEVGRIGAPRLAADGATVEADAVVYAPHDRLMTSRTRFWDTSGISFNIGTGGASVDFESVAALVAGGVSFETVVSGGDPVGSGDVFEVFANQDAARASLFEGGSGQTVLLSVVFEENVNGLSVGSPVTLRGLQIGEVASVTGRVDSELFGDDRVRLVVILSIGLEHLQLGERTDEAEILDFFAEAVELGWRARLARASLLTGGLKIELVEIPDAAPAEFRRDADPYPIFPSVAAEVPRLNASAEGLLQRVNDLPVEELLQSAITFMENAAALVASDEIRRIPGEVSGLIGEVRGVVGSEALQELPDQLTAIAAEFRTMLGELEATEGVRKLVAAVENAGEAAAEVSTAFENLPALLDSIEAVATKAGSLDIEPLIAEATQLVDAAGSVLAEEAARKLPETLTAALGKVEEAVTEATTLMREANEAEAGARLAEAIEAAGRAAEGVEAAAAGVPDLIAQVEAVAAKAEAMELDALVAEVTDLVTSFEAIVGTQEAQALPERLGATLEQLSGALAELRAGGTVQNVNAALDSARIAAESVAAASDDLPGLVQRTEAVLREAEQALAGLSDTGSLNRETRAALREVSRAAESVRSLARTLERKPNALLTGK